MSAGNCFTSVSWKPCYFATASEPFHLQIYDGPDTSSRLLESLTGTLSDLIRNDESSFRSTGNYLLLHMTSDYSERDTGFYAVYNASKSVCKVKFRNIGFDSYCT